MNSLGSSRADMLSERLLDFAVNIIKLTNNLSKVIAGRHVAKQLLRSGTSPGANYEEARGAESRADFIHKLGIVLKELRETRYWLKIIKRSKLNQSELLYSTLNEGEQLCAMVGSSVLTAKSKKLEMIKK